MGMFDKDKEIGLILTSVFQQGEQFILWGAHVDREDFPTKFGPSPRAALSVSKPDNPAQRLEVTTVASAIVAKVREAEPTDFPALVMWRTVQADRSPSGQAVVLQFLATYGEADRSTPPQAPQMDALATAQDRTGGRDFAAANPPLPSAPPTDDDIPF
jgi:hypothetical protein